MLDGILQTVLLSVEQFMPPEIKSCFGQQKSGLYFYKSLFANILFTFETVLRMLRLPPVSPLAVGPSSGFSATDVCLAEKERQIVDSIQRGLFCLLFR